jgi:hypothetical protein
MIQSRTTTRHRTVAMPAPTHTRAAAVDVAAAAIHLGRLRYWRDLLVTGLESTIWPDRSARTLRRERLALGIDLPELDAVALWSVRCGDGTLSIPFIDYILARAREAAARFEAWDQSGVLRGWTVLLEDVLAELTPAGAPTVTPQGAPAAALPRLEEVRVPEEMVASLCGSGGILDRIVDLCETLTLAAAHHATPEAS